MSRIIKETTVYGGPRTSGYATMATLHQNQSVTAIFRELDFLFVEYDGVNRTKRRGYVLARDVQLQDYITESVEHKKGQHLQREDIISQRSSQKSASSRHHTAGSRP